MRVITQDPTSKQPPIEKRNKIQNLSFDLESQAQRERKREAFELSHLRLGSQIESGNRSYFSHDLFPCYDSNFIKNCFFFIYNLIHGSMRLNLDASSCVLSFPFFDLKILF